MKLYGTLTSPFANKVRICAQILGLWENIDSIHVDLSNPGPTFCQLTPLRQIPVLMTADGGAILDSTVICLYLDGLAGGGRLLPLGEPARSQRLTIAALCNGLVEAAMGLRREDQRPPELRSERHAAKQLATIGRIMEHLASRTEELGAKADLATITLVAGLDWIALRHGQYRLLETQPVLTDWYARAHAAWVPALAQGAFKSLAGK